MVGYLPKLHLVGLQPNFHESVGKGMREFVLRVGRKSETKSGRKAKGEGVGRPQGLVRSRCIRYADYWSRSGCTCPDKISYLLSRLFRRVAWPF